MIWGGRGSVSCPAAVAQEVATPTRGPNTNPHHPLPQCTEEHPDFPDQRMCVFENVLIRDNTLVFVSSKQSSLAPIYISWERTFEGDQLLDIRVEHPKNIPAADLKVGAAMRGSIVFMRIGVWRKEGRRGGWERMMEGATARDCSKWGEHRGGCCPGKSNQTRCCPSGPSQGVEVVEAAGLFHQMHPVNYYHLFTEVVPTMHYTLCKALRLCKHQVRPVGGR